MNNHGKLEKYGTILLTDELRLLDGRVIACIYADQQWIFHKQRYDRSHPNSYTTASGDKNFYSLFVPLLNLITCNIFISLLVKLKAIQQPVTNEFLLAILEKSKGLE